MQAWFAIQEAVENELNVRDRKMLEMSGNSRWALQTMTQMLQDRRSSRLTALHDLHEAGDSLDFDDGSVLSDWEVFS